MSINSAFGNTLLHIAPGRWWMGEFFGRRVRPRRSSGEKRSLTVSSELLNMLLHVTPGRWWRGNFPGGSSSAEERRGEFVGGVRPSVRSERYTKMAELYVMPWASVVLARKVRRRLAQADN